MRAQLANAGRRPTQRPARLHGREPKCVCTLRAALWVSYAWTGMGRRVITREFYDGLVEAYAAHPGNAAAASRAAGCDARTAKRAWAIGWPAYDFARPIKEVVRERQEAARALTVQREQAAAQAAIEGTRDSVMALRTQAELDKAKSMADDAQLAKGAKQNALAAAATAMNLLRRGFKISEGLTEEELHKLPPLQRINALRTISGFARDAVECADAAVRLERLILGDPTEVVQHQHVHVSVTPNEMASVVSRAQAAVERARAAGIIDVTATDNANS